MLSRIFFFSFYLSRAFLSIFNSFDLRPISDRCECVRVYVQRIFSRSDDNLGENI